MAPSRLAVSSTWLAGTNRNSGFGSMKRLINHGQAMRSTRACSRVTHFMTVSPCSSVQESAPPHGGAQDGSKGRQLAQAVADDSDDGAGGHRLQRSQTP